ncbi:class I SAM-dependent methyltransferase [Candidatus Woesearchaeota archaeon]|nr:class I SAM-dependent methyltransferase [Candidatus Woesearchaeota archaeon]
MKLRYYLSPNFLEKESIIKEIKIFLKKNKSFIKRKKILDVGCGSKPYAHLFREYECTYEGIDFKGYSLNPSFELEEPDYFFSKEYASNFKINNLKEKSFDIIVSFQVLEHHANPENFFKESKRLLKKGGLIIITFPFIWPLHEEPYDYQRLTHYKIKRIADSLKLKILYIRKRGGFFSVIDQLLNNAIMECRLPPIIKKFLYLIIFLPLQYLVVVIEKLTPYNKNKKTFLGYFIALKKY